MKIKINSDAKLVVRDNMKKIIEKIHVLWQYIIWPRYLSIGSGDVVLDVGCGIGSYTTRAIRRKLKSDVRIIGTDISLSSLEKAKNTNIFDGLVLSDARKPPFKEKKADVVICLELIEHFNKSDGLKVISSIEKIAMREVVISTPRGFTPQGIINENPYQVHISGWDINDFRKMDYKVRGLAGWIYFSEKLSKIKFLSYFLNIISYFLQPFFHFFPSKAPRLICIKKGKLE